MFESETDESFPLEPKPAPSQLTYEDLSIDDTLSQLERVRRYVASSIPLQRLVHVKMLASTARMAGCVLS